MSSLLFAYFGFVSVIKSVQYLVGIVCAFLCPRLLSSEVVGR